MYIETSNSTVGQNGILMSPVVTIARNQSKCFSLWYFMLGGHVGSLDVLTYAGGQTNVIWTKQGQQGARWNRILLTLYSPAQFQVCANSLLIIFLKLNV